MPNSLAIVLSLVVLAGGSVRAQEPTLVIENARIIIGDGTVLERGTVVLAGERIIEVSAEPVDVTGARRIDAAGRSVLPGLIDTHVHLLMEKLFEQPRTDKAMQESVEERLQARLAAYTDAGITTVMSAGDYWPFIAEVRERVESGQLAGPRIYTAGPLFNAPGGHPAATFCGSLDVNGPNPWCREHLTEEVGTPEAARAAVARVAREGADRIKLVYGPEGDPDVNEMTAEVMETIVSAAHHHGLRAYAHTLDSSSAISAFEKGLDGLVHAPVSAPDTDHAYRLAELMSTGRIRASTTLTVFDSMMELAAEAGNAEMASSMSQLLEGMKQTLTILGEKDAGLIVVGTDSPHLPPGDAYHREIRLVSETGLTPPRIIQAATGDAAAHIGAAGELGTVEAGKLADLIVVDGDPLTNVAALREIVLVIKGGEILADTNDR